MSDVVATNNRSEFRLDEQSKLVATLLYRNCHRGKHKTSRLKLVSNTETLTRTRESTFPTREYSKLICAARNLVSNEPMKRVGSAAADGSTGRRARH